LGLRSCIVSMLLELKMAVCMKLSGGYVVLSSVDATENLSSQHVLQIGAQTNDRRISPRALGYIYGPSSDLAV
jgi:hypothetical protein